MFRKSRRKIVAAIMSVLVLLWIGTLGVIYFSSYLEMKQQNTRMLQAHAEMYNLPLSTPGRPFPSGNPGFRPSFSDSPAFQLSTFYTVAVSYSGEILEIKNEPPTLHSNSDLTALAKGIIRGQKATGTKNNLAFYKTDKGGYILVTFKDNTVVNESAWMLLRYTLIFGSVALVAFFFLSAFLAKKIVDPLEESYEKQKQFVSDAGHELKTPVAVVSANAELLSREIGDNRWLSNILYENERMGMLVGQLLELARTENVAPQMDCINFSRLVAGETLPFESVAFEKGLTLNSHIASGIAVNGNSSQLKQLVAILLDNAIRHSEDAGEIYLHLSKDHGYAKFSVINTGEEIPLAHREKIFERFYRADTARNSEGNHYGLGLAIAKAITEAHKGHIHVLCNNGLVEFCVQIPIT